MAEKAANPYLTSAGVINPTQLPPELQPQMQDISGQKRLAEMLLQNQDMPQGQMVSGRYVAPSFFQYLAPIANAYTGVKMAEKAETKQTELAKALRGHYADEMATYYDKLYGKKGRAATPETFVSPEGKTYTADQLAQTNMLARDENDNLLPNWKVNAGVAGTPDIAANPFEAFKFAQQAYNPMLQNMVAEGMKPIKLAAGEKMYRVNPLTGKEEAFASGGEKVPEKLQAAAMALGLSQDPATWSPQDLARVRHLAFPKTGGGDGEGGGGGGGGGNVNNNGIKKGSYDKMGRYKAPDGTVYSAKDVGESRDAHDAAVDLAYKLNQITKGDVKNAYGSVMDYTTNAAGQYFGPTGTLDAQTKINNLQIGALLKNLGQLKGASSDKEMAQMIKDFPSYRASPEVMNAWIERAAATTNRFLKRSEGRFGFDTEYAEQGRFGTAEKTSGVKEEKAVTGAPKVGEIRQGYRFKGGDQYDQKNWEKVK